MNRSQIENLYKVNGLIDFHLKTTDDLLKVHGINFKAVDGYNRLDDLNKVIYEKFIINFFNAQGLEYRDIVPTGIYYVEEIEYLVKERSEDDYMTIAGGMVKAIDKNGLKTVLGNWLHESYKHLEIKESEPNNYLRFQYEHQGRSEWLHVIKDGTQWY